MLIPDESRYTCEPVVYETIHALKKKQMDCFWTVSEVDIGEDLQQWQNDERLTPQVKHAILNILAFFATGDGIVAEVIILRLVAEAQVWELKQWYAVQGMFELEIHAPTYAMLLTAYVKDKVEKQSLLRAASDHPQIAAKKEWTLKHMTEGEYTVGSPEHVRDYSRRIVSLVVVEGIFFSSSFCAIHWLKPKGLLPGLCFSNELISRDEGIHCTVGCEVYKLLGSVLSREEVLEIMVSGTEVECDFVKATIQEGILGFTPAMMCDYVRFVCDTTLVMLGYDKYYNIPNPCTWMESQSLEGKTNFFEKRVSEYQLAAGTKTRLTQSEPIAKLTFDEDF